MTPEKKLARNARNKAAKLAKAATALAVEAAKPINPAFDQSIFFKTPKRCWLGSTSLWWIGGKTAPTHGDSHRNRSGHGLEFAAANLVENEAKPTVEPVTEAVTEAIPTPEQVDAAVQSVVDGEYYA